jgi:hypothetical protein
MADVTFPVAGGATKRLRDMGDGTWAEVVVIGGDEVPITLTGDLVVDTLGTLGDDPESDPAAASATIPSILRGLLKEAVRGDYETVAASANNVAIGATGAAGDLLAGVLIVPGTAAAGAVSIKDGGGSAISIFVGGGVTALPTLAPFFVELGIRSLAGAWHITTGANVTAIAVGKFT